MTSTDDTSPEGSAHALLEHSLEHERAQLLQVHALLKCLYQALLYAEHDDAVIHADVANLAAKLINESAGRLDKLRMEPAIEASRVRRRARDADGVRDSGRVAYLS